MTYCHMKIWVIVTWFFVCSGLVQMHLCIKYEGSVINQGYMKDGLRKIEKMTTIYKK